MFDQKLWTQAKKYALPLTLTIIFGVLIGGVIVAQAWLISKIISQVFLEKKTLADIQPILIQLLILIIFRAIIMIGREVCAGALSVSVKTDLREKLFSHLLALGPQLRSTERTGELSSTLVQGIEKLDAYFRQYLPTLALSALVPTIILLIVFPLDWLTGLVFLFTAPLIPLFMVLIARQAEKETHRQWRLLGRLSSHFQDVLQGLETLKSFGRSKQQAGTIQKVSERYAGATLKVLRIAFLSALVLELLATLSTAIVAVQIGLRLMYGQLEFVVALFILILAPEFYMPLRQLGASFHSGMDGISAAAIIFSMLEQPLQKTTLNLHREFNLNQGLEFKSVSYSYPDGNRPAISQVSFQLTPGDKTALVGLSGAGKSTVVKILLGFIQPESGEVIIGNQILGQIDLWSWREKLAWVPQFPYIFHASIEENIRLAKPGASDSEVIEASRKANADEFIQSLPAGYGTEVGERGARLSGGQAQRIALARAFLKDAPLIVLDEPGANLDAANQEIISEAIGRILADRMALIIAHRISTIQHSDHIVVLEDGQVVQTGSFQQLKQDPGQFKKLILANQGGIK